VIVVPSKNRPQRDPNDDRPEIQCEPGTLVWIVKSDDALQWRDHVVTQNGDCEIIPLSAIGKLKGACYLTEAVLRPIDMMELMKLAHNFAVQMKGAGNAQASAAASSGEG
jgi:hypothetical protein